MIRLFSTQFPLKDKNSLDDLLEASKVWVSGSQWSVFEKEDLADLKDHGSIKRKDNYSFEVGRAETNEYKVIGIRYTNPSYEGDKFHTTIVGSKSEREFLTSIVLEYDSNVIKTRAPSFKKPYVVKLVLKSLGGGRDGDILVSDRPVFLNEGDEEFVADFFIGSSNIIMPIVYLSADNNNCVLVNPSQLANYLSGVANVLVEPSREFSFKLKKLMRGRNVYGGAIGVYWHDGSNKLFWHPNEISSESVREIYHEVINALNYRRLRPDLTWDNLQSLHNSAVLRSMKESHSKDLDGYLQLYDEQLNNKDKENQSLLELLGKVEAELRRAKSITGSEHGLIEDPQIVQLYIGEVRQIILDCIRLHIGYLPDGFNRRKQILRSVLETNETDNQTRKDIEEKIKRMFKNYDGLDGNMRSELKKMGFSITDDGKHYKLFISGEEGGICVTFPKTPGDHRSGKNAAADILRTFF